ncbi:DUF72 domain-containing protein [Labrys sp. KNU-23]|uniref:DUF72 domain-containing protein n=1 Tax=Labrys sp. KNU-23 TaxID=2789216 RepID=UPI0011ECE1A5|nr:DUF72 domain-containing protein [Labrys sp. KNU-23]QEN85284.1 DUF72 domain-containing protein [Labrys sp. KNU-23]
MHRGDVRIGISGWNYPPWRGDFYPQGLRHTDELAYASGLLETIEVNSTFYRLQTPTTFARWFDQTPDDFVFAVKAPRFITHVKRLRQFSAPLANFLASGVLRLGHKLGPILWQLPPSFRFDEGLLADFLKQLPRDTAAAVHAARKHDDRLRTEPWLKTPSERPMRHALEIRHESFLVSDFITLLRKNDVALVCADSVDWPLVMDATSDFIYCRLHGSRELYRSAYNAKAIDLWARRAKAWTQGRTPAESRLVGAAKDVSRRRDVFVFFDNTDKLQAPHDARALMERLGQPVRQPTSATIRGIQEHGTPRTTRR